MLSAKTPPRGLRGEENIAISSSYSGGRIRLFQQRPVSARRMEYAINCRRAIDAAANSLSVMAFAERGPTRSLWNRTISSHAEERMAGLGAGIQLVEHRADLVDGICVRSLQALGFYLEDPRTLIEHPLACFICRDAQHDHIPSPFLVMNTGSENSCARAETALQSFRRTVDEVICRGHNSLIYTSCLDAYGGEDIEMDAAMSVRAVGLFLQPAQGRNHSLARSDSSDHGLCWAFNTQMLGWRFLPFIARKKPFTILMEKSKCFYCSL